MKNNYNTLLRGLMLLVLLACNLAVSAQTIKASNTNSKLTFDGEHAGMPFSGIFEQWQSTLTLPPSQPASIIATFVLSSAKTGDWTYDSTLPEADWFDIAQYPTGKFISSSMSTTPQGFDVSGELTLRGITKPVKFSLLGSLENGFTANITIDRLMFDIGKESDPDAQWVSRDIGLSLSIHP